MQILGKIQKQFVRNISFCFDDLDSKDNYGHIEVSEWATGDGLDIDILGCTDYFLRLNNNQVAALKRALNEMEQMQTTHKRPKESSGQ